MSHLDYPEPRPVDWLKQTWKIAVHTDRFDGDLRWVHLMSFLEGPEAWRIASSVGHAFRCPVRVIHEYDPTNYIESEGDE